MDKDFETVDIKYQFTEVKNIWGGHRVECVYIMTHHKGLLENSYNVICRLGGLSDASPYLSVDEIKWIGDLDFPNEETLTEESATILFEENIN